jgi:hypothetical protein
MDVVGCQYRESFSVEGRARKQLSAGLIKGVRQELIYARIRTTHPAAGLWRDPA